MADCFVKTGVYRNASDVVRLCVDERGASCDRRRLGILSFKSWDKGSRFQHWWKNAQKSARSLLQ